MEILYSEKHSAMFIKQMLYKLKFIKHFITELILRNNKNGQLQTQILVTLLSWNTAHYMSGPLKAARLLVEQSDSKSQWKNQEWEYLTTRLEWQYHKYFLC